MEEIPSNLIFKTLSKQMRMDIVKKNYYVKEGNNLDKLKINIGKSNNSSNTPVTNQANLINKLDYLKKNKNDFIKENRENFSSEDSSGSDDSFTSAVNDPGKESFNNNQELLELKTRLIKLDYFTNQSNVIRLENNILTKKSLNKKPTKPVKRHIHNNNQNSVSININKGSINNNNELGSTINNNNKLNSYFFNLEKEIELDLLDRKVSTENQDNKDILKSKLKKKFESFDITKYNKLNKELNYNDEGDKEDYELMYSEENEENRASHSNMSQGNINYKNNSHSSANKNINIMNVMNSKKLSFTSGNVFWMKIYKLFFEINSNFRVVDDLILNKNFSLIKGNKANNSVNNNESLIDDFTSQNNNTTSLRPTPKNKNFFNINNNMRKVNQFDASKKSIVMRNSVNTNTNNLNSTYTTSINNINNLNNNNYQYKKPSSNNISSSIIEKEVVNNINTNNTNIISPLMKKRNENKRVSVKSNVSLSKKVKKDNNYTINLNNVKLITNFTNPTSKRTLSLFELKLRALPFKFQEESKLELAEELSKPLSKVYNYMLNFETINSNILSKKRIKRNRVFKSNNKQEGLNHLKVPVNNQIQGNSNNSGNYRNSNFNRSTRKQMSVINVPMKNNFLISSNTRLSVNNVGMNFGKKFSLANDYKTSRTISQNNIISRLTAINISSINKDSSISNEFPQMKLVIDDKNEGDLNKNNFNKTISSTKNKYSTLSSRSQDKKSIDTLNPNNEIIKQYRSNNKANNSKDNDIDVNSKTIKFQNTMKHQDYVDPVHKPIKKVTIDKSLNLKSKFNSNSNINSLDTGRLNEYSTLNETNKNTISVAKMKNFNIPEEEVNNETSNYNIKEISNSVADSYSINNNTNNNEDKNDVGVKEGVINITKKYDKENNIIGNKISHTQIKQQKKCLFHLSKENDNVENINIKEKLSLSQNSSITSFNNLNIKGKVHSEKIIKQFKYKLNNKSSTNVEKSNNNSIENSLSKSSNDASFDNCKLKNYRRINIKSKSTKLKSFKHLRLKRIKPKAKSLSKKSFEKNNYSLLTEERDKLIEKCKLIKKD